MSEKLPRAIEAAVRELSKLPTIGRKSAQRLAFHLLKAPEGEVNALADSVRALKTHVRLCRQCFFVSEADLCDICSDPRRDPAQLCVVEESLDVAAFERAGIFRGLYHVLLGRLSPLQGVTPDDLKIGELMQRLRSGNVQELILATNPNVDGDATALYLSKLAEPLNIRTTRLGLGLSIGSSLEYADELTLQKAMEGRKELG